MYLNKRKGTVEKGTIETLIFFILSPFLSIPFLFHQIKKGDRIASYLFCLFIGVLGFLYIPSVTDDKARYFEMYKMYGNFDYWGFRRHLDYYKIPDRLYDYIFYIFSHLKIRFEVMFFILTSVSVALYSRVLFLIVERGRFTMRNTIILSLFGFVSFTFVGLFSGLRFTFASSFLIGSFYYIFILRKDFVGVLFLIISLQIHFSMLFFVPLILLVRFVNINIKWLRIAFLMSLTLVIYPLPFFVDVLNLIGFGGGLAKKVLDYTAEEDFISRNFATDVNSIIAFILKTLWYYVVIIYLVVKRNTLVFDGLSGVLVRIIYVMMIMVNFTRSFLTIFERYIQIVKLFFIIYLLYRLVNYVEQSKFNYKVIFVFYFISILIDINAFRFNFIASIWDIENLLSVSMFFKEFDSSKFLKPL